MSISRTIYARLSAPNKHCSHKPHLQAGIAQDGLPILAPNRLGIGGWSNGGFMTEYAITRTTRFKAAVAQAGHSDFFSLYGTSSFMHGSMRIITPDSPYHNRKWYDDHSPITLIRNCRTPTLVIHGIGDGGVPVGQAYEILYRAKRRWSGNRDGGLSASWLGSINI